MSAPAQTEAPAIPRPAGEGPGARTTTRAPGPAELRALMATVREEPAALREAFSEEVDWPLLLRLAERELATPILHRCVAFLEAEGSPPGIPEGVRSELERRARIQELRALALDCHLDHLLEAFRGEGIEVVLLKGAALRKTLYRSPVDRPMNDLDLLVEPEEAERAWEVARGLGWRWRDELYPWARYEAHHHLPPLADPGGLRLKVEIHREPFPAKNPFTLDAPAVWHSGEALEAHPGAWVPCPEHLLLHAALHLAWSHIMISGTWKTLRDVNALVSSGSVDWNRFLRLAGESRGSTAAYWTLRLGQRWAGASLPAEAASLAPPLPRLAMRALDRHFAYQFLGRASAPGRVRLEQRLWELAIRPGSSGHGKVRPWSSSIPAPGQNASSDGQEADHRGPGPRTRTKQAADALRYLVRIGAGR